MAVIDRSVDLRVPASVAEAKWDDFINGMIIGSGLAPGERERPFRWYKAEREAEEGTVRFEDTGAGTSRLTVTLEYGDRDLPEAVTEEELRGYLSEDLELFKRYVEGEARAA
jgi:hypothetical protein